MRHDPLKHLWNPPNEHALVHQAIHDFPTYSRHGIHPDDYFGELAGQLVQLAADAWEKGPPDAPFTRVLGLGQDRGWLAPEGVQAAIENFMDPPIAVLPDPERLKAHRRFRDLRVALLRAVARLEEGEPTHALAVLEQARETAERRLAEAVAVQSAPEFVHDWLTAVDAMAGEEGISLGLPTFKRVLGPIAPGSVLTIGANTNVGKSAIAAEMMLLAAKDGTGVGCISLEDPRVITVSRLVSAFAGVAPTKLMRGEEPERRHKGCLELVEYGERLLLSECIAGNEQHVMARMSVMAQRGAKLVIVDYIGEVHASVPQQDRRNEVRYVLARLKSHASRLGIALVVLSQITRPKDHDPKKPPTKHDLKESGDLENASEYVVMMWREVEHDFAPVHLTVVKSKLGGNGIRWMMQREVDVEGPYGERLPGSARLREVARTPAEATDYRTPLVVEDYVARCAALAAKTGKQR